MTRDLYREAVEKKREELTAAIADLIRAWHQVHGTGRPVELDIEDRKTCIVLRLKEKAH